MDCISDSNIIRNEILRFYRNMGRSIFDILLLESADINRYFQFQQKRVIKKTKQIFFEK